MMEKSQKLNVVAIVVIALNLTIFPWWYMSVESQMDFFGQSMESKGSRTTGVMWSRISIELLGESGSNMTLISEFKDDENFGSGPGNKLVIVFILVLITLVL